MEIMVSRKILGMSVKSNEYAKHARPFGKKVTNKSVRKAAKVEIQKEAAIITVVPRKVIREKINYGWVSSMDIIDTSLVSAIEKIKEIEKKCTELGYKNVAFDSVIYSDEGSVEIRLYGDRDETDVEYEKRLRDTRNAQIAAKKAATTRKRNQELKDKEEYERLKAKFEGGK